MSGFNYMIVPILRAIFINGREDRTWSKGHEITGELIEAAVGVDQVL